MAGTENTGQYVVMCHTVLGRVGVRTLSGGSSRVRVEPISTEAAGIMAASLTRPGYWKQPGDNGQPRFSRMASNDCGLRAVLAQALIALRVHQGAELNPNAPAWVRELVTASGIAQPTPAVAPSTTPAFEPVVVEGNDPAALRSEASLLREEAGQLRERSRLDVIKASELEARAAACIERATEIEVALAAFAAAKKRARQLGVSLPSSGGAKAGLMLLTKPQLLGLAGKRGLKVLKSTKKVDIIELIAEV